MGRDQNSFGGAHLERQATRSAKGRYEGHAACEATDHDEGPAVSGENANIVLIVEDDELVSSRLASSATRSWELRPLVAADYGTAIALARAHRPAFGVIDLCLRGGGNGIELIREMRRDGSDARLVLITGLGTHQDVIDAIRGGADDVLRKPFMPNQLASKLLPQRSWPRVDNPDPPGVYSVDLLLWEYFHTVQRETHNIRETARLTGVDRKTVKRYLKMLRPPR